MHIGQKKITMLSNRIPVYFLSKSTFSHKTSLIEIIAENEKNTTNSMGNEQLDQSRSINTCKITS
jgi:hypothetical protein